MSYRRYRPKRSTAGEMLADTSFIANRLSWRGAAILGCVLFAVFYWTLPARIHHQINSLRNDMFRLMPEVVFARRIHWLQWLGIALGPVSAFFPVHNYLSSQQLDRHGEHSIGLLSRLQARILD